ncbi:MAG: hypothetical protein IJW45_01970 [Oscillospiraceae bacterium]|nr:hypothetical protein [Oscillospiraceae bacterium]
MSYVGRWTFHSIGTFNDENEMIYLDAQAYLASPMPYIDETDEEAVADERKERKQMVGMQVAVCQDGKLYLLMPLPEGVSQAEVEEVVRAGRIQLFDGMMTDGPMTWEERDGKLLVDMGAEELIKVSDGDGFLTIMTTRYVKID